MPRIHSGPEPNLDGKHPDLCRHAWSIEMGLGYWFCVMCEKTWQRYEPNRDSATATTYYFGVVD